MRKPDKDNPYLTHRFLYCFSDNNICQIIFSLKNNKINAKATWKTAPNWEVIELEYLLWSNEISLYYEEILLDIIGPFKINPFDNSVELIKEDE